MKIEELKHNHSLTDLLKILLFTILMLAPIFMVASRCLYVIANKNAYQSYSDSKLVATNVQPTNRTQIVANSLLTFTYDENSTNTGTQTIKYYYSALSFNPNDYQWDNRNWQALQIIFNGNNKYIYLFADDNSYQAKNIWGTTLTTFGLTSTGNFGDTNYGITAQNTNVSMISYQQQKLDNVFEYSVSQLEDSNLFNWTQNTAIYSGINAMNTQLGINSPAITIVLTYWLILTCIYIIIDIVLKLFTYITHMIGSRKA